MPFIPALNTLQVRMQFLQDFQQVENVFHVVKGSAWSFSDIDAIATVFASWWQAHRKSSCAANASLQQVVATDLTTATGLQSTFTGGLPASGTSPGVPYPNNCSVAIKLVTGTRGRSFRGRTYLIGLTEQEVLQNELKSVAISALLAMYRTMLTEIPGAVAGSSLAIASFHHLGAPRPAAVVTPVIDVAIDPIVDSQRRRLPGRGR